MKISKLIDQAQTPDRNLMTLHERDGVYAIRINGSELMSSWHHNSEEKIAELACEHVKTKKNARILIGGLGLGYTLRSALRQLKSDASVEVAEIMECVIKWNSDPTLKLAADVLADPRTKIIHDDVFQVIRKNAGRYDSIIIDVDNGPDAFSSDKNQHLYQEPGLQLIVAALKPGGCLAVWSASDDLQFPKLMKRCGFEVKVEKVSSHANGGGLHTLFMGRVADKKSVGPPGGR